jgi:hypothetical protein
MDKRTKQHLPFALLHPYLYAGPLGDIADAAHSQNRCNQGKRDVVLHKRGEVVLQVAWVWVVAQPVCGDDVGAAA